MNGKEKEALKNALHEINNALNAVSMQSELALVHARKGDTAQLEAVVAGIMRSCRRCSTISHDLQASLLEDGS